MSSILRAAAAAALLLLPLSACAKQPGTPAADFTLTSDRGTAWQLSAQRGSTVVLTFGFTHCADTCPATIAKLVHLTKGLGAAGDRVRIAFVTVDPRRDGVAAMHRFVGRFDGGQTLAGLTGTAAQIAAVERAYHVWAQPVPGRQRGGGYDVAHTAAIYVIDPNGRLVAVRDDDDSEKALAATIRETFS